MNAKELAAQFPRRIELHAHTKGASPCSVIAPEELVETYSALGYDAVVITNHYSGELVKGEKEAAIDRYLQDYKEAKQAAEKTGLRVYLGAELRFVGNCNDYLLFGVDRDVLRAAFDSFPTDPHEYYTRFKTDRTLFVQAHPFRNECFRWDPKDLDGIEVVNGHPDHNSHNAWACRWAIEHGKIATAGSDYHHPNAAGLTAMRVRELPEDSFALAELLRSGDYLMEVGGKILLP